MQLNGKIALVTGGGTGIGAACAKTLAREGAKVAVADINIATAYAIAEEINASGGKAIALEQDVTQEQRWPQIIAAIDTAFGPLTTLVANAGIAIRANITDMSLEDWRRQQSINLDGVFLSVKYGVLAMRRAGQGSIIIMSSVAGLRGAAGLAGYCASKGGARLFAKAAAMECAQNNDPIRVNSVHPGIIDTAIWGKMDALGGPALSNTPIDIRGMAAIGVPMGRVGDAADVANAVLFLASEASSYMTGSEIIVDGGMTGGVVRRG